MTVGGRVLLVLAGVTGCLALAGPASAARAGAAPADAARVGSTATNYAGYGATSAATSVSGQVTVPRVSCAGIAAGAVAGQDTGVHLDSSGIQVTADIRSYCHGTRAGYQTEFVVPRASGDFFVPARVTVHPGDVVSMSVTTSSSGSAAQMQDVTTGSSGTTTGLALASPSPYTVMTEIAENAHGGILTYGLPPSGNPYLPGPVASSPVRLREVRVDGRPLAGATGLFAVTWVNSSNQPLVTPSAIRNGGTFSMTVTP